VKGQVVTRERIDASGARVETTRGDCTAWQSAEWSARGPRVYLRSGDKCAAGDTHSGTGVIAMTGRGEWLYIQGMTLGGQTGVRVQRYRELASDFALPDEVTNALRLDVTATMWARAAAGAPLATEDVIDASRHVDAAVLEVLLTERGEPFTLDAKRLIALADAGVPSRVIDLMIALSNPNVFAINAMSRMGERVVSTARGGGAGNGYDMVQANTLCSTFYPLYFYNSLYDCTGLYRGYDSPFGYGSGWYPAGGVPVVYVGSGGGSRPHGRVVNGQGYRPGTGGSGATGAMPRRADTGSGTASGATSATGSSSTTSSSSSSSNSGGERTAHHRPQQ
jgi:hypothetical protein